MHGTRVKRSTSHAPHWTRLVTKRIVTTVISNSLWVKDFAYGVLRLGDSIVLCVFLAKTVTHIAVRTVHTVGIHISWIPMEPSEGTLFGCRAKIIVLYAGHTSMWVKCLHLGIETLHGEGAFQTYTWVLCFAWCVVYYLEITSLT